MFKLYICIHMWYKGFKKIYPNIFISGFSCNLYKLIMYIVDQAASSVSSNPGSSNDGLANLGDHIVDHAFKIKI